ncbi:MAG: pyridoxal phosphate-dependent aminotransferase, partial [Vicinamibacteria bacterium]
MTAKAKAMRAQGIDVIGFGAGEPDFDTPESIKQAAGQALTEGFTKYTPAGGTPELRDAVVAKTKRDLGLDYKRENVIISCGGKHSLFTWAQAFLDPEDEVIVPSPYWVSYPWFVRLAHAKPVVAETREAEGFKLSPQSFERAITRKTKAIILNSPSNPTGAAYEKEELAALAEVAVRRGVWVISDEMYEKMVYDGFQFASIAQLGVRIRDLTIIVGGVSKTYSMTGWRIGYTIGPPELVEAMGRIQDQSTSNPTSIAQRAATEALLGPQDEVNKMVREFAKRREVILDKLARIPGITCARPQGAFYVFPNVSRFFGRKHGDKVIQGSGDLAAYLLERGRVAVVPGDGFGA